MTRSPTPRDSRPQTPDPYGWRPWARSALPALAAVIVLAGPATAQVVDERLIPGGTVRLSVWPSFTAWDERFGSEGEGGRVPLGSPLGGASALSLFPEATFVTEELRALSGLAGWSPTTGPIEGGVQHDVTRIDLGVSVGLTDGWSIGAIVPRVKTRTAVDLLFTPDTAAGDLGVSPRLTDPGGLDGFLQALGQASLAAGARAQALCDGGDPGCATATALAARAARLSSGLTGLYETTPLFPLDGSAIADALLANVATLEADLVAAGLPGIGRPLSLATVGLTEGALRGLPSQFPPLAYAAPLSGRTDLWGWGDLEISTALRLLDLHRPGTSGRPLRLELLGGALVRVGTGASPSPDLPFALGTGDGQTDIEGRLVAQLDLGRTLILRVGAAYGVQGARDLTRRVPSSGSALSLLASRATFSWDPGDYAVLEAEPGVRLADGLLLAASYRYRMQQADVFRSTATSGSSALPLSGTRSLHQVGGTLFYDSVLPERARGSRPLRLRIRLLHALSGSGPDVPAATRVEAGLEVFPRLWGDR